MDIVLIPVTFILNQHSSSLGLKGFQYVSSIIEECRIVGSETVAHLVQESAVNREEANVVEHG